MMRGRIRPGGSPGPTAVLALAVLALASAAQATGPEPSNGSGSIVGRVSPSGPNSRARVPAPYPSRSVGRRALPAAESEAALVYLRTAPSAGGLRPMAARLAQRNEAFVPGLVAVTLGSSVDFPNEDPYFHNVFSLSRIAQFNLGRYPRGDSRTWRFDRAGMVRVFCDIHSNMNATVFVFDHPFFAIPDRDGKFRLDSVPAGKHTLVVWRGRSAEQERALEVKVDQTTTADLGEAGR